MSRRTGGRPRHALTEKLRRARNLQHDEDALKRLEDVLDLREPSRDWS